MSPSRAFYLNQSNSLAAAVAIILIFRPPRANFRTLHKEQHKFYITHSQMHKGTDRRGKRCHVAEHEYNKKRVRILRSYLHVNKHKTKIIKQ